MPYRSLPFVLLTLISLFSGVVTHAEHFPGGTLSYRCLGGNQYEVKLLLWRICSGSAMQPQSLLFSSDCGVQFGLNSLQPVLVEDVSPLCTAELPNGACSGGPLPGFEAYTYLTTVSLEPCDGWTISWSICCRGPSLNVVGTPGLYMETRLNSLTAPCNNSPVFTDPAVPFVCVGQPVNYPTAAVEPDGHVVRYRMIEARYAAPGPFGVNYVFPHYGASPWTGMAIDSITGTITFTPDQLGFVITVVEAMEYNAGGEYIGSVIRDFPFVVNACSNTEPDASSGTITATDGAGLATGPREAVFCSSGNGCMTLAFSDPDAGQVLGFTSNVETVLPGAMLEASTTSPGIVTLCWDATGAPPGVRSFLIWASDDACPIPGVQGYVYTITVVTAPDAGADGSAVVCSLTPPFALLDSLPAALEGGSWTAPDGGAHSGTFFPADQPPGAYAYVVTNPAGCTDTALVHVDMLPPDDPYCVWLGVPAAPERSWSWYWDPATRHLNVLGLERPAGGHLTVRVLDLGGRLVLQRNVAWVAGRMVVELPGALGDGLFAIQFMEASGRGIRSLLLAVY